MQTCQENISSFGAVSPQFLTVSTFQNFPLLFDNKWVMEDMHTLFAQCGDFTMNGVDASMTGVDGSLVAGNGQGGQDGSFWWPD